MGSIEQRRAVEHGIGVAGHSGLVIAGAGLGKTNTLAHQLAASAGDRVFMRSFASKLHFHFVN